MIEHVPTPHAHLLELIKENGRVRFARFSRMYVQWRNESETEDRVALLMEAKVSEDHESITFDLQHKGWRALLKQRVKRQRENSQAQWIAAAGRVAHGLIGLFKSTLGIDRAVETVIKRRASICSTCAENVPCFEGTNRRCCGKLIDVLKPNSPTCGCVIKSKVTISHEQCPMDKW